MQKQTNHNGNAVSQQRSEDIHPLGRECTRDQSEDADRRNLDHEQHHIQDHFVQIGK